MSLQKESEEFPASQMTDLPALKTHRAGIEAEDISVL
jgi:hypothetical protein